MKYLLVGLVLGYIFFSPAYAATADRRDFCEETAVSDTDYDKCVKEQKDARVFLKEKFKYLQVSALGAQHPDYIAYFTCKKDNTDSEDLVNKAAWKQCLVNASKETVAKAK